MALYSKTSFVLLVAVFSNAAFAQSPTQYNPPVSPSSKIPPSSSRVRIPYVGYPTPPPATTPTPLPPIVPTPFPPGITPPPVPTPPPTTGNLDKLPKGEPPGCTLRASPTTVTSRSYPCVSNNTLKTCSYPQGNPTTLTFTPKGTVTSASIPEVGAISTSGTSSFPAYPPYGTAAHTFVATVTGPLGTSACSATIYVQCYVTAARWVVNEYGCWVLVIPYNNPPWCYWRACLGSGACNDRGVVMGCFAPGASILMADQTTKKAELVRSGDLLWNPMRWKAARVKNISVGREKLKLIELGYREGQKLVSVKVTTEHPILTLKGIKLADQVSLEDSIQGTGLKFHRVTLKRRLPLDPNQMVYNFELEGSASADDHWILADGVVTGDLFLQRALKQKTLVLP